MKTVLITGGTGFLGKNLQDAIKLHDQTNNFKYHFVGGRDFDLTKQDQTIEMFKLYKPDIVVSLNALCGGIGLNSKRPADLMLANLQMSVNIFEQLLKFNVKKIYTLGSVCAYPKYCKTPFKEDDIWDGFPEETNSGYGISKRAMMLLGQTYRQQYGIGGAHLIPVNMFGPEDSFDPEKSHVVPAIIKKTIEAKLNGSSKVYCWGSGEATRELFYVEDCAEAIIKAITMELDTDLPINLGTGKDISIYDLAHLIAKLVGFEGEVVFENKGLDGQPKRQLCTNRAKQLLNFEAKTDLETGLKKTIEWYKQNHLK